MQTEPEPPPSPSSAESAVGLTFVAIVLVSLFAAGSLGVVATLDSAPSPGTAQQPEVTAVAAATPAVLVREKIVSRFRELMLLREIALRERDPRLLESVYAPGAAGLAADRAEIARLRAPAAAWTACACRSRSSTPSGPATGAGWWSPASAAPRPGW